MDSDVLIGAIIGSIAAIVGGIIGGYAQGVAWFHFEQKRAAKVDQAILRKEALEWAADGRKKSFRRADLRAFDLQHVDFGPGDGRDVGVDMYAAELSHAKLWGANLQKADLEHAVLCSAHLQDAVLQEAKLRKANLSHARLVHADFQKANLREAELTCADLDSANLQSADLSGAVLRGASLRGANLKGVKYDTRTVWPDGFSPPAEAMASGSKSAGSSPAKPAAL